jgi:dihydrofolate reductase
MQIRTRMCMSADGYIATSDGWPAQLAVPGWDPDSYGFVEFQARCDAVLMGRTTFEPALGADEWPWRDVDVFVLGSHRPAGTPDEVVVESNPIRLLEQVRAANRGGDIHLIGGPRTIETFRQLAALDEIGLLVLPVLLGEGMQLTPAVSTEASLMLKSARALAGHAVEITYSCE